MAEEINNQILTKSNNLIGVTGEYLVCAELGKMGVLALLTPKNNPVFDVLAVAPDGSRTVVIQVKTMSEKNNQGWKLNKDICEKRNNPNLFTVLVNMTTSGVDYYIYDYDTLAQKVSDGYKSYIDTPKRNGESRKDISFRWFDFKMFTEDDYNRKNNWKLLGF